MTQTILDLLASFIGSFMAGAAFYAVGGPSRAAAALFVVWQVGGVMFVRRAEKKRERVQ
jgi:hypothetical protein